MAGAALTPQAQQVLAQNRTIRRTLGRFSGPEFFIQQAFAINTSPVLVRPVPVGVAVFGLKFVWRGRIVIGTANVSPICAEAPQTIINRLMITGASARFGQQTLWDISGSTLFAWARLFQVRGNSLYIGSGAAYTRQADLSVPLQQAGATFGNTGTYDLEIHYDLPFVPMLGSVARIPQLNYSLRPEDWPNGISVQVFFGDGNSFGTVGTSTFTFTAWGSGAGTPTLLVYTNTVNLNDLRGSLPSAICVRSEQQGIQSVAAVANNVLLLSPARQRITNIVIKQGTSLAGSQANCFGTLGDLALGLVQLKYNGTLPRNFQDWWALKEYYGLMLETILPGGYGMLSFVESSNLDAALDATSLPTGADFSLVASVLTAGATQQVNLIQEYVIGDAQTRLPGT
jgi:hypothetical protein